MAASCIAVQHGSGGLPGPARGRRRPTRAGPTGHLRGPALVASRDRTGPDPARAPAGWAAPGPSREAAELVSSSGSRAARARVEQVAVQVDVELDRGEA